MVTSPLLIVLVCSIACDRVFFIWTKNEGRPKMEQDAKRGKERKNKKALQSAGQNGDGGI